MIRRILTIIVAANITEYHILSKLNFPRTIIQKFRRLFHIKNSIKNVKNHGRFVFCSTEPSNQKVGIILLFIVLYVNKQF